MRPIMVLSQAKNISKQRARTSGNLKLVTLKFFILEIYIYILHPNKLGCFTATEKKLILVPISYKLTVLFYIVHQYLVSIKLGT